jgi:hypothetical protein
MLVPALAVCVCLALLTQVKAADYLVTGAMLAVGSGLWLVARRTSGAAGSPPAG